MTAAGGVRRGLRTVEHSFALEALETILGSAGGFLELEARFQDGERGSAWLDPHKWPGDLAHYVELHEDLNANQTLSLARPKRRWGSPSRFPVLWCRIEQKKGAQALRQTAQRGSKIPVPTVVLREGGSSRYTAFWALRRPVMKYADVLRANERLSYALHGRRKSANPDHFEFTPPGAVIRDFGGTGRPCPVVATHVGLEAYSVREVVDLLRDAPDLDALRERNYQPLER